MKFRYIKLFFLLTIFIISSCSKNETEQLFDNDPTVRINNKKNELKELLKSSADGWRVTYFTNEQTNGGYTFNFRFKDNNIVEMLSDFTGDGTVVESEYDVNIGATVNLVFTSGGLIHDIANNANEGDFEFLYQGQEGEDLIFKTNRSFKEIRFEKIVADDWVNFDLFKTNATRFGKSVFKMLKIKNETYELSFKESTRFARSNVANFGVGFTTTGLVISPAIVIDEQEVRNFEYDTTKQEFIAVNSSGVELASIKFSSAPPLPLTGYEDFNNYLEVQFFRNLSSTNFDLDTNSYLEFINKAISEIRNTTSGGFSNVELIGVWFRDLDKDTESTLIFNTNLGAVTFVINKEIVDDKVIFTKVSTNFAPFDPILKPFSDFLLDPEGFYVTNEGSGGRATIMSLVSVKDPSIKFGAWTRNF